MNGGQFTASRNRLLFVLLWLFIIAVSVYDGFCVLTTRSTIQSVERNPVGLWLIRKNSGDIWLLLAAKTVGTVVAATLLLRLHSIRQNLGWIVCGGVAAFQLFLLYWLVG